MTEKCKRPDIETVAICDEAIMPISGINNLPPQRGRVVYIHPQKRFMTIEFENGIRESYCAYGPLS